MSNVPAFRTAGAGMMRPGLVVAEEMALVRAGLVALLTPSWAPGLVASAGTLREALDLAAQNASCVLLLDLGLLGDLSNGACGAEGYAALQAVRQRLPMVGIVALAGQETRDGIVQCLAAGAHGYVGKSAPAADLLRAVAVVRAGGVHVPLALAGTPVPNLATAPPVLPVAPPVSRVLTGRQRDVLRLMAEGRSTKDIARTLDLAVSTIKVHLAAVYRAVGARNRVEALCRAGLLPHEPLLS